MVDGNVAALVEARRWPHSIAAIVSKRAEIMLTRTKRLQTVRLVGAALCGLYLAASAITPLAAEPVMQAGDAAVTAFSGTTTEANVPADVHPLDRTFIDESRSSLKIFDLSRLGTGPRGLLADAPVRHQVPARDIGQVFGITLEPQGDRAPNIYVAASSLFGLQIVAPNDAGGFDRLVNGDAKAQWMPGQFANLQGGTPGSILRIDGETGAVSLFADIRHEGRENAGPGLGALAFDAANRQIFVSDLETGLIHRIGMDGAVRDAFDHGVKAREAVGLDAIAYDASRRMSISSAAFNVEDSATWGYADARRRVFALGIAAGRLYYAVSEGPAVWSVSLTADGGFGADARIELQPDAAPGVEITSITFDGAGMMYLAQRGAIEGSYDYTAFAAPAQAQVLRYRWDEKAGRWTEVPESYAIGLKSEHQHAQGGVALNYGYDKNGNVDRSQCRQTVWATGENLRDGEDVVRVSSGGAGIVHGLQGVYKSRVRPANEPPYESWFTDYDGAFADIEAYGQVGAVAIHAPCQAGQPTDSGRTVTPEIIGFDPPADDASLILEKRCFAAAIGAKIRCEILVRNTGEAIPVEDVRIDDLTRILAGPGAGGVVPIIAVDVPEPGIICAALPALDFFCTIPAALLTPGETIVIDVFVDTHDLVLAGNLGFRNCATLKHPDGFAKACAEGGADIVVEKIGPGVCAPGGGCKFGLRIANTGAMPFAGDVLLADAMFIGGAVAPVPVTSVNPPIACNAGDTNQLPFSCRMPLSLMPGEELIHWVEVTMPAPGGYWAENCFGALDPALLPVGPMPPGFGIGGGGDNPSCVWVEVPEPIQQVNQSPAKVPPVIVPTPRCPDGRVRRSDGSCLCRKGSTWNAETRRCETPAPRCYDKERRREDGTCCPRGTSYDRETGRCRKDTWVCPDPERRRTDGSCCPLDTVVSENGRRCVGTEIVCPRDTRWNYALRRCVPVRPVCGPEERYDWRKRRCVPVREDCPFGTRFDRSLRRCVPDVSCPQGTHWNRIRYRCEKDEVGNACPDGSSHLSDGSCRCPQNRRWNKRTQACERIGFDPIVPGGGIDYCPPGQKRLREKCVPSGIDEPGLSPCPKGQRRVGRLCLPDRLDGDGGRDSGPCPRGSKRISGACIPRLDDPPRKDLPKVRDPKDRLNDIPKIREPKVREPKVRIPKVPDLKIKEPKLRREPKIRDQQLPKVREPKIKTPDIKLKVPQIRIGPSGIPGLNIGGGKIKRQGPGNFDGPKRGPGGGVPGLLKKN